MSATPTRTPRLGRGLSSLMGRAVQVSPPADAPPAANGTAAAAPGAPAPAAKTDGLTHLPVQAIRANPHQPRQNFDAKALEALADSIKVDGLMQPIIVRPIAGATPGNDKVPTYELVAGERRWRAAQLAGLTHIPSIVRQLNDRQLAEWALIENLQREDLNPMERAEAFEHLQSAFHLAHDDIAQRVGVERSSVTNYLRLIELDGVVKDLVRAAVLSLGQAKALAGLVDPAKQRLVAKRAVQQAWSVRQVEQAVRHASGATADDAGQSDSGAATPMKTRSAYLADLEEQLGKQLQTKIHIRPGRKKGSGTMTIEFYSLDHFDSVVARLGLKASE